MIPKRFLAALLDALQVSPCLRAPDAFALLDLAELPGSFVVLSVVEELNGVLKQNFISRPGFDLLHVSLDLRPVLGMLQNKFAGLFEFLLGVVYALLLEQVNSPIKESLLESVGLFGRVAGGIEIGLSVFIVRLLLGDLLKQFAGVLHLGLVEELDRPLVPAVERLLGGCNRLVERREQHQTKHSQGNATSIARQFFAPDH